MFSNVSRYRTLILSLMVFFLGFSIFAYRLDTPAAFFFDEPTYVGAAREMIERGTNSNWSHPPLGKAMIAAGIKAGGDNPFGARIASAIAGSLILVGFFLLGQLVLGSTVAGLMTAFFGLFNHYHFLHSRTANLDIFMMLFLTAAFLFFARVWRAYESATIPRGRDLYGLGLCLGLAGGCKWFGLAPIPLVLFLLHQRDINRSRYYGHLIALPLVTYLVVQIFILGMRPPSAISPTGEPYSLWNLLTTQKEMLFTHLFVLHRHAFESIWLDWIFGWGAMWWDYRTSEIDADKVTQAVIYFGNPVIVALGLVALAYQFWQANRGPAKIQNVWFLWFLYLWLIWTLLFTREGFLYYFYPAAMLLNLQIVKTLRELKTPVWLQASLMALALLCFLYFYPALTGMPLKHDDALWFMLFKILR